MRIIVGVDGSAPSERAVDWCTAHAGVLEAEVVAVHSVEMPVYAASGFGGLMLPVPSGPDLEEIRDVVEREWCAPLSKAHVAFRVVVAEGSAASSIMTAAERESADLVVTGRRGRGGFAELLLGSTSHQLSHHLDRPLLIVP